ncbi:MAG: oligosaccharide flippase family protein [Actinomycetota bacterium]
MTDQEGTAPASPSAASPGGRPGGLRQRVLTGGLIMSAVAVLGRGSSLAAQLILGRILLEDEFGLYALALGWVTIASAVRSIMRPVLIEALTNEPEEADHLFRTVLYTLIGLAVLGAAASPLIETSFDEDDLARLLIPMFLLMPLQLAPMMGLAKLSTAMDFNRVGRIEAIAGLTRHAVTIVAAIAGLGALSFVFGILGAAVAEHGLIRRYLGSWPSYRPPDPGEVRRRIQTSFEPGHTRRWVWVSAVALALGVSGDYLGASLYATAAVVGVYFFAYQLTGALFDPMNVVATTVLVPAFATIDDTEARRRAYLTTLRSLSVVGTLFFFAAITVLGPTIHWLWDGKWDEATFAVVAFAAYAPVRLTHPCTQNVARACGFWNLFVTDMILVGAVTFTTAAAGAYVGGLTEMVLFVIGGHLVVTLISAFRLSRRLAQPYVPVLRTTLGPWSVGLLALAVADRFGGGITSVNWADVPLRIVIVGAVLAVGIALPERAMLTELATSILRRRTAT